MMQSLEGTLEKITYYNEETFFLVARLRSSENQLTTIIGNMPQFSVGERLLVRGEWVHHKSFGRQFKVADYEILTPQSEKGIRNFWPGLIRGVGPSTAEK